MIKFFVSYLTGDRNYRGLRTTSPQQAYPNNDNFNRVNNQFNNMSNSAQQQSNIQMFGANNGFQMSSNQNRRMM
jgi:hypothetical protein